MRPKLRYAGKMIFPSKEPFLCSILYTLRQHFDDCTAIVPTVALTAYVVIRTVGCVHIYLTHRCQLLFTSPLTTTSAEFPLGSMDQYPTLFSGFPNGRADKIVVVPSPH